MKQVSQVGVDVDSEKLVCAMQQAGQRMPLATFANPAKRARNDPSLNDLVRSLQQRLRHGDPERLCGLQVDH